MRARFRFARAERLNGMRAQPRDRVIDAVRSAIARMVIGGGGDGDVRELETGDGFGRSMENKAGFEIAAAVRKRRFEIDKSDVGGGHEGSDFAKRQRGIVRGDDLTANRAAEHHVTGEDQTIEARLERVLRGERGANGEKR